MDVVSRAKNSRVLYDAIRRNGAIYGVLKRRLERLRDAPLRERVEFTRRRLDAVLACARNTVHGKAIGAADLAGWPVLEKQALRGREHELLTRPAWSCCRSQTSGTTGTPLTVYRSLASLVVEQICIDHVVSRFGYDLREMRSAVLRGDSIKAPADTRPPFWKETEGGRTLVLSSSHLTSDNLEYYLEELRRFHPQGLFAYPSSLHALCAMIERSGESLHLPLVVTSSEVLEPATVALARRILGCELADYYGQCERVAFAESDDEGGYRFVPGYAHIELTFSRGEDGEDLYEIVGTNLWNTAMPLVRFRTGDLVTVPEGTSATQLEEIAYGLRPFKRIHGRDDGIYIHGVGGTRLFGMPKIMNGVRNVYQSQIVQEAVDRVKIIIVPTVAFCNADREQILANARAKIPESIRLDIITGDRLETTRAGKSPFIIRKIAS